MKAITKYVEQQLALPKRAIDPLLRFFDVCCSVGNGICSSSYRLRQGCPWRGRSEGSRPQTSGPANRSPIRG